MPTKKIRDFDHHEVCRHPDHEPHKMMVFKPGIYEHTCPGCGRRVIFTIGAEPSLRAGHQVHQRGEDHSDSL